MGYGIAILAIVLVAGFLITRRHSATGADNTPKPSSHEDNTPKPWSYVDSTPKQWWDGDTTPTPRRSYAHGATAAASNDRAKDRRAAIDFVRRLMENKSSYVILDTETTGLNKTDEIVQLAVIDLDGNVLFNENIKPTKRKRMSPDAVAIHGLTMKALSQCPTFAELAVPLERAIGGKTVIAYNALFDGHMYAQTLKLAGGFMHMGDWADIMGEYAKYVGEWSDYFHDYKWQELPGGTHSALGDCLATLELLRKMAATTD